MSILNCELQPDDIEKFCVNCLDYIRSTNNLTNLVLFIGKEDKKYHLDVHTDKKSRKLTTKEIFLIQITCK